MEGTIAGWQRSNHAAPHSENPGGPAFMINSSFDFKRFACDARYQFRLFIAIPSFPTACRRRRSSGGAYANGVDLWALTDHDGVRWPPEEGRRPRRPACASSMVSRYPASSGRAFRFTVGLGFDARDRALVEGLRPRQGASSVPGGWRGACRRWHPRCCEGAEPGPTRIRSRVPTLPAIWCRSALPAMCSASSSITWTANPATSINGDVGGFREMDQQPVAAVVAHPGATRCPAPRCAASSMSSRRLRAWHRGDLRQPCAGSCDAFARLARHYDLRSRGSDFHGLEESYVDLGKLPQLPEDLKPVWRLVL